MANGAILGQTFLSINGGSMNGNIDMNSQKITELGSPSLGTDGANKNYVDGKIKYGTSDPGVGSPLATGTLYAVYE